MSITQEQKRFFQRIKSMSHEQFWEAMNVLHNRAYAAAERQYGEAMDIELQPKQKARVLDRVVHIREHWDSMRTVTTSNTVAEVFTPRGGNKDDGTKGA